MEAIRESILAGVRSRKSKCSIIKTDLDSIRATILGKFYEGIVAQWLDAHEGYSFQKGKPCVYWKDLQIPEALTAYHTSLENLKNNKKIRTNSDGLFLRTTSQECYLWEAKNWPKWSAGLRDKDQIQIKNIFEITPWVFAKQVRHEGKDKPVAGVIFSWWNEFDGFEAFEEEISHMIGSEFKLYFTSSIIDDCRKEQYEWYISLIKEQQSNISEFFAELLAAQDPNTDENVTVNQSATNKGGNR